ncbi:MULTISPECIES: bacteriohemerythrin [unclassified Thioalkalivibrio]|uniref:bacteriohemerythrin n=1 Tax=unclassified Thioalkalivibrio TaxID=2621013 RepID=UPI00037EB7C5|nr:MULTISPECIES: bacteriohemerythrin [unclassified Thioalkalivibrio]PYG01361.1 hemerythrin [Thioalkalivibrio sp. ALE21]
MPYVHWSDDLDTGIPVIDNQHKRIVEYINRLCEAVEGQATREQVHEVLDQVVDYTLTHFAFEEEMLEIVEYPDLEQHRKSHEAFSQRIRQYQQDFADGHDVASELGETLRDWLMNHIRKDDHEYGHMVRDWMHAHAPNGVLQD